MTIIFFLIILAILIFIHELGHFWSAKKSGIKVEKFAIGFPPKIFSKKVGETEYSLNAIPIGGYVKIFGEDPHSEVIKESEKSVSFYYKPKYIQAFVLSAGVLMNILFGFLLISLSFMVGMPVQEGHSKFGQVKNPKLLITNVLPNSPAYKGGVKSGDIVLFAENGNKTIQDSTPEKVTEFIRNSTGEVSLLLKNGNNIPRLVNVLPSQEIISGQKAIGVSLGMVGELKLPVHKAIIEGFLTTKDLLFAIVKGFIGLVGGLFTGQADTSSVSGPIGIANIVGEARTLGFIYLLSLTALISLNLAVLNLIPFPALDGGRLLFVFIEAIIRRNIHPKVQTYVNAFGFVVLILLMILVTVGDVKKFF
jgi:regulator of sigma E protease